MRRIGFIGAGNMGGAMIRAIATNLASEVAIYDVNSKICESFDMPNVVIYKELEELVKKSQFIVLTVKPQYYEVVGKEIEPFITNEHVVVTVAPGYSIDRVKKILGQDKKIIRTMPNTPALVGKGITAFCYEIEKIEENIIKDFLEYFNTFGKCILIKEEQMEAVVAVSGSSPAYTYIFIEAMADAAVRFGLPRDMAYEMSALAIQGACEMVLKTNKCPAELKDQVTSPGGTTIEAVIKLEESGFRNSVISAMTACYDKAKSMNKEN